MCTHMVDIPYNAVVEVVLVDEGMDTAFAMIIVLTVFTQTVPALNNQIFFKEIQLKKQYSHILHFFYPIISLPVISYNFFLITIQFFK